MSTSPPRQGKKFLPKSPDAEPDLHRAIDTIPQLVWSASPDGSVEFCNRRWLEYTGLTAEQAQGWGWRVAIHPEDADELVAMWRRVLAEGVPGEAKARMRKADGSFRWFLIRAKPQRDDQGRIARWYGTNTDIDELKRAGQALSLANDRLRLAMQAGTSVGWDSEVKSGRDVWFGDLQTIFGIPSDTYAGSVEEFIRYVHPDDRQQVSEALADARQNRRLYAPEFRVVRPDGTIRWLVARGKFYFAPNGDPERMLGVSLDITDRKLAEERLREYEKAVEGSEEMIAVIDREYRYLIANRKFLKLRNMTKEQVVGRLADEVLNGGVFEAGVKKKLDECFRGNVVRYEMKYTYPELGERDVFVSYFPIEGDTGIDRVACILQDITDRKRTEEALRKSEERFRLAALAGKMYAYEWDVATDRVMRSEEHVNVLGFSDQAKQLTRQQLLARVHPDDRALFIGSVDQITPENPTTQISYRMVRPDGSVVWLEKSARAFFDEQGRMLRVIGMVADITERKRAEEVLESVSRRLIDAQEQERTRIARELHDDIGQRLALLTIGLVELQQNSPDLPAEVRNRMGELQKQTSEIATDIQSLSHELHSSKLQYLGIVVAMRSFCKEFGEQQKVEIDFEIHDLPSPLSPDISLCFFRVLQEALHNAAKHSRVRHFEVRLWGTSGEIHLTVRDSGAGFDTDAARKGRGLGLTSMQERLKLVDGELSIDSHLKGGTTIHARVPLSSGSDSMRAAG
jgi:PAS domain S-box-containing protein